MTNLTIEILGKEQEIEGNEAVVSIFNRVDQNIIEIGPPINCRQTYVARHKIVKTHYILIIIPYGNSDQWLEKWKEDSPASDQWEILGTLENITNGN